MHTQNGDLVDYIFHTLEVAKKAYSLLPPLPAHMKPVHIRVLHAIYRIRDTSGNSRISAISEATGLQLPNTTKCINELVELHAIKKFTDTADKRVVLVQTTPLGEQYINDYVLSYHKRLLVDFEMLDKSDYTIMAETMDKIYNIFQKDQQNACSSKGISQND